LTFARKGSLILTCPRFLSHSSAPATESAVKSG
jgi:hypothetical protein